MQHGERETRKASSGAEAPFRPGSFQGSKDPCSLRQEWTNPHPQDFRNQPTRRSRAQILPYPPQKAVILSEAQRSRRTCFCFSAADSPNFSAQDATKSAADFPKISPSIPPRNAPVAHPRGPARNDPHAAAVTRNAGFVHALVVSKAIAKSPPSGISGDRCRLNRDRNHDNRTGPEAK